MIGADIGQAAGKLSRDPNRSLNTLLPPDVGTSSQVLIDSLPDQVGDRPPSRRRRLPKSFQLYFRELHLGSHHANMLAFMTSCYRAACCSRKREFSVCHRKCTDCVNAPFPAESQAAKRTHFLPVASNGMRYRCVERGTSDVAGMIWRSVVWPSPQTSSTNSAGQVQSAS